MTARPVPLGLLAAAVVLAADQASKWWILNGLDLPAREALPVLPFVDLTMVWNRGVTFGMLNGLGAWSGPAIALAALVIVAVLVLWLRRAQSRVTALALGAVAGGAIGNIMDRLRHGAVVDFIHADLAGWFPYVFNVGDAAIVCGVIALVLDSQWPRREHRGGCDLPKPPQPG